MIHPVAVTPWSFAMRSHGATIPVGRPGAVMVLVVYGGGVARGSGLGPGLGLGLGLVTVGGPSAGVGSPEGATIPQHLRSSMMVAPKGHSTVIYDDLRRAPWLTWLVG